MSKSSPFTPQFDFALEEYVKEYGPYYRQWLFDKPFAATPEVVSSFQKAGLAIHKFIKFFGENFVEAGLHKHMPVPDRLLHILDVFNRRRPFEDIGTYRTDFVLDRNCNPKFIEITCQFSLNAFFQAGVFNHYVKEYVLAEGVEGYWDDYWAQFLPFMRGKLGSVESICVIKGWDKIQSSRFFVPFFRNAGYEVREISYKEVWEHREFIKKSLVISEIMIGEIATLSDDEIALLADSRLINDYRNILIAHDKRFFALLNDPVLQREILSPGEIADLVPFLIDSFPCAPELMEEHGVMNNKDEWILKHVNLGRSREIFAGLELDQADWEKRLREASPKDFILQRWVPQRTFEGTVGGVAHADYLTGTLLYFDERFFGLGWFRTSSHYVANKVDNRNLPIVALKDEAALQGLPLVARF